MSELQNNEDNKITEEIIFDFLKKNLHIDLCVDRDNRGDEEVYRFKFKAELYDPKNKKYVTLAECDESIYNTITN